MKALLTSGCPNCVRSANGLVEVHRVRVHGQAGEPDVVGVRDRAAEAAAEDVADGEVLVVAAPATPSAPVIAPRASRRQRSRRARSTTGRSTIVPFTASTPSLCVPRTPRRCRRAHAISPSLGAKTRLIVSTCAGWMQALPRKPSARASRHCSSSPAVVAEVEVDDVERPAEARRGRVDRDLGAGEEDLLPVRPRLEPDLGAEVDGAEDQRGDARLRADLVRLPQAHRGLDDRDHRRAVRPERVDRLGARLRQHDRVDAGGAAARARSPSYHGVPAALTRTSRAGPIAAPASALADDVAGAPPCPAARRRPRGRRRPRRRPRREPSRACARRCPARRGVSARAGGPSADERLCQTFGERVNHGTRPGRARLTGSRKSDINARASVPADKEVDRVKAVRFHEFGGSTFCGSRRSTIRGRAPGEVLVRIRASALNHLDVDVREGISRFPVALPHTLGVEVAGEIEEVGEGRRGLGGRRPGQPVHHGHLRRVPVLPHRSRVALPDARLHQLLDGRRLRGDARRQGRAT